MRMIKRLLAIAVIMVSVAGIFSSANAASLAVKPEAAIQEAFPDLKVDSMKEIDIPGCYEVISGSNVLYYFPAKDYIFVGEIVTKERKSLTAARKKEISSKFVKDLPLEKAVKIGSGKNVVIEITDPDCPYCRKGSDFLKKKQNLTRYIFFAPLAHPNAITKIHYILNAKDKAAAYEEMMAGGTPPQDAVYSESIKALAQEHLSLAQKIGVQGTPTFYINGKEVVGADERKIEEYLKEGKSALSG